MEGKLMSDKPDQNPPKQPTYNGQPIRGFILPREQPQQVSMPPANNHILKKKVYVPSLWSIIIIIVLTLACGVIATALGKNTNNSPAIVATPTMQQRINQIVQDDGLGHNLSIEFDLASNTIIVTDDIGEQWDNSTYQNVGKQAILNIQKALWQSNLHPHEVTVDILGPMLDKYGNTSTDNIMYASLTSDTALKCNWDNLYSDSAWDVYDDTWMLPDLKNN